MHNDYSNSNSSRKERNKILGGFVQGRDVRSEKQGRKKVLVAHAVVQRNVPIA